MSDSKGNKSTFAIGISQKFALVNKLITRDLNTRRNTTEALTRYTKDQISTFIANPLANEKQLRAAVRYIYGASPHFKRLIQYFVGLNDLSYFVAPYRLNPKQVRQKTVENNYRKVLNSLNIMNIRTQFPKILKVVLREDVYYGTMWVSDKSIIIQQLPSDQCQISSIVDNVLNVSFNFAYFDNKIELLDHYPPEFRTKYEAYKRLSTNRGSKNKSEIKGQWIELDSPTSFAVKFDTDILDYALPPFANLLREVYDIEDYKQLKLTKTALENYAMLAMTLPMGKDGEWLIDENKAREFWSNLDAVMPEEVGSVLTPMPIEKISFERSHADDANSVSEAENSLFTSAGVSSLLFNNDKASSNALLLSIKADQSMTYGIVKSIEDVVNRFIQAQSYGKNFKVTFLDVSPFNRKEMGDQYIKAAQYGLPTITMYAASQGLGQSEFELMSYLENDILGYQELLKPLKNSATMTKEELDGDNPQGGRPEADPDELSDNGELAKEGSGDDR